MVGSSAPTASFSGTGRKPGAHCQRFSKGCLKCSGVVAPAVAARPLPVPGRARPDRYSGAEQEDRSPDLVAWRL